MREPERYLRIRTKQQLEAAMHWGQMDVLLLDGELADPRQAETLVQEADALRVCLCLPEIVRQSKLRRIEELVRTLTPAAGLLIRNLDELGMLRRSGAQERFLIADPFLYACNSEAAAFYTDLFPQMYFICSDELTEREQRRLKIEGSRLIRKVYGYQPLMVSAQCLSRERSACTEKERPFRGSRKEPYFLQENCGLCFSVIYQGTCTWTEERAAADGCENILYDFTKEDSREMMEILRHHRPEHVLAGHYDKGIQ